jgi:hypothetical protein
VIAVAICCMIALLSVASPWATDESSGNVLTPVTG